MIERNVKSWSESNAPVFFGEAYNPYYVHQCKAWLGKLSQHDLPRRVRHKRLSEVSDEWLPHVWLWQPFTSFTKRRTSYDQLQDKQFVTLKSQIWLLKREIDELRAELAPLETDPFFQWYQENRAVVEELRGRHIAVHPQQGVVAHGETYEVVYDTVQELSMLDEVEFNYIPR